MSNIIDEGILISNQILDSLHQSQSQRISAQQKQLKQDNDEIVKILNKFLNTINSDYLIQNITDTSKSLIKLKILFYNGGFIGLSVILTLTFNLHLRCLQTNLSLMEASKPFKIQTSDQRIIASKLFSKFSQHTLNKISIEIADGSCKIIRPIILSSDQRFSQVLQSKCKQQSLQNIIKNSVKDGINTFKPLLRQLTPSFLDDSTSSLKKFQQLVSKTIYRYIIRSPIEPAFDVSFGSGKYDTMEYLTKEEIANTNSMIQNIDTDFSFFKNHLLYLNPLIPLQSLKQLYAKQYFTSNDQELNSLKQKAMPPPNRVNLNMESKYVYNIIQLNQNTPIDLKRINMGGFAQISKAQAQFWYMLTVSNKKMAKLDQVKRNLQQNQTISQLKLKKQNKKCLVFKTNNYKGTESGRNRIIHQMKIVSKFKGSSSIFLPEYFKVTNQNSPFSSYLIMEYLPYPTLNEYTDLNKYSMSFLTKIHLASLMIQSLRYLKTYEIVHMDLKPSNIIISKRLIIKLIDFGQSYNKQVCEKNFKPAFSMPYGSPQIFDGVGKTDFTQKNDVYSWGVIFYELLFKKLPFIFSRQQAHTIFKQRIYMNSMYFVPQEQQKYGSFQMLPLLRSVIFKALDKDAKNRPCTLWLTVVLKQCLSHLINMELNLNT